MNNKEKFLLFIPLVISFLIVSILHLVLRDNIIINNFNIITNSYISFIGTLVGFLITTITIVLGFFNSRIIKIIVNSEKDKILYINWIATIVIGIFSALFAFYLAATFNNDTSVIYKIPFEIIIFLTISFIEYLIMSLIYFFGITMLVIQENKDEEEIVKLDPNKLKNPNSKD